VEAEGTVDRSPVRGGLGARIAPAVVAVALLLGACSGGSSGDRAETDGAGGGSSTSAPSAAAESTVPASTTTPVATTVPIDLRTTDLLHRTYRVVCPGGEVEVDASAPAAVGADGTPLTVTGFVPRYVDLTGDGRVEALLPVTCLWSADLTSATGSVVVVGADASGPLQLGGPIPGSDPVVVGQVVATGRPLPVAGEAPCCAATVRYEALAFSDGSWIPASGGAPATEADPIVPQGLGSIAIDTPYGELAIATGGPVDVVGAAATQDACTTVAFASGGAGVTGYGGDGVLRSLVITVPGARTVEGLGVGSTEAEVTTAITTGLESYDLGDGTRELVHVPADDPELITSFELVAGTVTAVVVGHQGWAEEGGGCA